MELSWEEEQVSQFMVDFGLLQKIRYFFLPVLKWLGFKCLAMLGSLAKIIRYLLASFPQVFAMPETALGLFPDIGASYFLSRLPGFFGNQFEPLFQHLK